MYISDLFIYILKFFFIHISLTQQPRIFLSFCSPGDTTRKTRGGTLYQVVGNLQIFWIPILPVSDWTATFSSILLGIDLQFSCHSLTFSRFCRSTSVETNDLRQITVRRDRPQFSVLTYRVFTLVNKCELRYQEEASYGNRPFGGNRTEAY